MLLHEYLGAAINPKSLLHLFPGKPTCSVFQHMLGTEWAGVVVVGQRRDVSAAVGSGGVGQQDFSAGEENEKQRQRHSSKI